MAPTESVSLHGIRIGDRDRTGRGWLVVSVRRPVRPRGRGARSLTQ
jgi:hypothetical protein